MKNKTVKMILAVAVLAVCCGAYVGVKTYVSKQEEKESEEEEEAEKTIVFSASADDIKSLDFVIDKKETTFEKNDDTWVKTDETDFPVNQTTLDSAASSLTDIESDRVITDVEDLAEYGLDVPANTIKIVTEETSDEEEVTESDSEGNLKSDGEENTDSDSKESTDSENEEAGDVEDSSAATQTVTTLQIGDENTSTNQYYITKDDDKSTVYLIDSSVVEPFMKTLYDYAQEADFPAISNTDEINKVTVTGTDITSYELTKDSDTTLWNIKADNDEEKADSAKASTLTSIFSSMAYDSLVNYKCEDKSEYGLDKPYAVITVDYQEEQEVQDDTESQDENASSEDTAVSDSDSEELSDDSEIEENNNESESEDAEEESADAADKSEDTDTGTDTEEDSEEDEEPKTEIVDRQLIITVGNEADGDNRYVCVNDSQEVYTMSGDTLSSIIGKTAEDFWDMTVSYVSLNDLSDLKVTYDSKEYEVKVERETSEDEDGNETETTTYKLDGEEVEKTDFTTYYNKLINMSAQRRLTEDYEPESDPEMIVVFQKEDGSKTEVKYYSYDTNYYAAESDSKVYLVNKMTVKEMFDAFENFRGQQQETEDESSESTEDIDNTDDTEDTQSTENTDNTESTDSTGSTGSTETAEE